LFSGLFSDIAEGMGTIFISYRREDSAYALLLYHRLMEEFGSEQVFRDVEGIPPGEDFVGRLDETLRSSEAFVALIGKGWLRRRPSLSKPDDFVRRELLLALRRRFPVFPLLVGGAQMPSAKQLPRVLLGFARTNAIPVTDYRFDSDLDTLVEALGPKVRVTGRLQSSAGTGTEALIQSVSQLQLHAIQLIEARDIPSAKRTLAKGWDRLMELRRHAVPSPAFNVQLGYLYKTLAQAYDATGDTKQADHYMGLAASAFSRVEREGIAGAISVGDVAGALNGLGNAHSYRGESDEAIVSYRRAVAILPAYAYAWHDLFLEYLTLARHGRPDFKAMHEVLSRLKETGMHTEGIGPERIAQFKRELVELKRAKAHTA
jgi:hypothetical protein